MPKQLTVRAPAKINLHLRVLPLMQSNRNDGYHDIESLFQAVALYDELVVSEADGFGVCSVHCSAVKLPLKNTLTAAYTEFCDLTGVKGSVAVDVTKCIPSGAGLGGGSSDAAAMLIALDRLFNTGLDKKCMMQLACRIGSDVAFFLSSGCAVVTGRGEFIREITLRTDICFVLVQPEVHSSTAKAYKLLDEYVNRGKALMFPGVADLEAVYKKPVAQWTFVNSFTEPLTELYPVIADALRDVKASGAHFADMTGSGSVVYGVFPSVHEAENAYTRLCGAWKCKVVLPYALPS